MVLNPKAALKGLLVFHFGHQLSIEEGLDARPLADDPELVPLRRLEQSLGAFLVLRFLPLGRIEPTAHPDPVDTARLGLVDFALVALGFALVADQPETQARVEARKGHQQGRARGFSRGEVQRLEQHNIHQDQGRRKDGRGLHPKRVQHCGEL